MLTAWTVNLGSHVSSGTALASVVSPSRLTAEALISQADIADLKVGQKAQMTIDGYDGDAFTGRISFISSEPASSSSASGSSSSTQYSITVSAEDLPELAKSGMTGTLDIVIEQRENVLLVPTTAVSGSSEHVVRARDAGRQAGLPPGRDRHGDRRPPRRSPAASSRVRPWSPGSTQTAPRSTGTTSVAVQAAAGSVLQGMPAGGFPSGGIAAGGAPAGGGQ